MSTPKIKIYLVDDHKIFVSGLNTLLAMENDIEVVGFSFDGASTLLFLKEHSADVLITDVHMSGMSGIELTRLVKEMYPEIKVIGLSMFDKADVIKEVIAAGGDGYLVKDIEKQELLSAIKTVAGGMTYYSGALAQATLKIMPADTLLTKREKEIIRLIVQEKTNAMIAEELFISEHTVESHRKNIFRKTMAKSLVGLVKYAYDNNIN